MNSKILFAPVGFKKYSASATLPSRFGRLIDATPLKDMVKDKLTAVKMHLGGDLSTTTIHPLFVRILADKLKSYGANAYITDQNAGTRVTEAHSRGYSQAYLGLPLEPVCGVTDKYFYEKSVDFKTFMNVDIGGSVYDAEVLINLSHVKGHGVCGYGGACKNIAMGCVTDRTRGQLHGLEGGLRWDEGLCTHCEECVASCNHFANSFDAEGRYDINFHHCTLCQHCVKVCPTGAITLDAHHYEDFQKGMAICTAEVMKRFPPGSRYHINFLTDITAICDCWGISTPSLVPDIGIMASEDMVALERACLDAIKIENLIPAGVPEGRDMSGEGHLFERLHGKNPYVQVSELENIGLGTQDYQIIEIE